MIKMGNCYTLSKHMLCTFVGCKYNCYKKSQQYSSFDFYDFKDDLQNIKYDNTELFIPPIKHGLVIKVYDGDTITIASKLPYKQSPVYRFSVRLNGIDCPEIKGNNDNEKKCALIAREEVSNLLLNKIVHLENLQTEKYGRILADVYLDNINISNYLLEKHLAVKYDGGTKTRPNDWLEYYLKGNSINHK